MNVFFRVSLRKPAYLLFVGQITGSSLKSTKFQQNYNSFSIVPIMLGLTIPNQQKNRGYDFWELVSFALRQGKFV